MLPIGSCPEVTMPDTAPSPESLRFAEACVASGRYRDVPAVIEAGLRLLRAQDTERAAFAATLNAARAAGERDGYLGLEAVEAVLDADAAALAGDRA